MFGIKKDENYKLTELVPIIEARLGKKCPYLGHGSLNEFTRTLGYKPSWNNGINGQGYREKYVGSDCIAIIDKMMEYDEYITSDHIKELRARMYGN